MFGIASRLTAEERAAARRRWSGGKGAFRRLKRAQILLAADAGSTDEAIATQRRRRHVDGLSDQAALRRRGPRARAERGCRGRAPSGSSTVNEEALLVATACSKPPAGRARWTLELLADEMVRLTVARDALGGDDSSTARRDASSSPGRRRCGASRRSTPSSSRAWRMSSSSTPSRRRATARRVLRRDAAPAHRRGARARCAPKPGKPARFDYEYVRNGTANVFMFVDVTPPLAPREGDRPAHLHATSPSACATSSTCTTPTPSAFASCSTTSRPTRRRRSTRRSRLPRRAASCAGSSSTSRRSTRAGSTWSRSRSA